MWSQRMCNYNKQKKPKFKIHTWYIGLKKLHCITVDEWEIFEITLRNAVLVTCVHQIATLLVATLIIKMTVIRQKLKQ